MRLLDPCVSFIWVQAKYLRLTLDLLRKPEIWTIHGVPK
jgi:hypothetical protein